ncbi:hypothetical protein NLJ89_g2535 [Agrocybe chaxingu]|uniref:F-box domain-containing protein n=1 Tax=Agrocybe chaxingu TaxID=84603 RepID=A0A9W8K6E6_9AGAR|nr:hypothetical protein NLJ89_g2535 [Agrocybe chaxingu]
MPPTLPPDIFAIIFGRLEARDVLNVRLACKGFHQLSKLRTIWDSLLQRDVVQLDIPIPGLHGRALDSLSAEELEHAFHTALKLRRNWVADSPVIRRAVLVIGVPNSRIIALSLLPDESSRRLVSLSSLYGQQGVVVICCWDISSPNPICIARREVRQFGRMAVNWVASCHGKIAVVVGSKLEILSLASGTSSPSQAFVTSASIEVDHDIQGVDGFHGSLVLTRDRLRLYLWDINNPAAKIILTNDATQPSQFLDCVLAEQFILVLKAGAMELYALPPSIPAGPAPLELGPVVTHSWQWRVDDAAMSVRHGPRTHNGVTILLRYGTLFPWAVNVLHQYELRPNLFYDPFSPLTEMNLPYDFPPGLNDTIGSPVRLHATSDLAVGPYGTAIWIDSHTEDYFNHADQGQRLAGKLATVNYESSEDEEEPGLAQFTTSMATSVYAYQEEDNWVAVELDEVEGKIILGHDDGFITIQEYV